MNTPNDASDTQINRLVTETEPCSTCGQTDRHCEPCPDGLPVEREPTLDAIAESIKTQSFAAVAGQLADLQHYLSITDQALSESQLNFARNCLACAYLAGRSVDL